VTAGANLTTNGGDITLWANSAGATTGGIAVNNGTTLSSSGGWITLGGSAGNVAISGLPATSTLGTVLPQGYAQNISGSFTGLSLGTPVLSGQSANVTLNSGNGRVGLAGQSSIYAADSVNWFNWGLVAYNGVNINAGTGDLVMYGLASGNSALSNAYSWGLIVQPWDQNAAVLPSTWKTNGGNISINGSSTSAGAGAPASFGIDLQAFRSGSVITIENTSASSGSVTLNGSASGGATSLYGIRLSNNNVLSASGAINFNVASGTLEASASYTLNVGRAAGTDVTASTSPITLTANALNFAGTSNLSTSGTVTVQPYGNNFSSAVT
jgi:hypothetical protein